jgi:hypothetical protein
VSLSAEQLRRLAALNLPTEAFQEGSRPTPRVVVEAIWVCVRERGIAALAESSNQERLSRCDDAARAELERRLEKLGAAA